MAEPLFQFVGIFSMFIALILVLRVFLDPFLNFRLLEPVTNGLLLNAVAGTALFLTGLICVVGEFVVRCHRTALALPAYVVRERIDHSK